MPSMSPLRLALTSLALLASFSLSYAAPSPSSAPGSSAPTVVPQEVYNGGYGATEVKLRISNGGAGQSGLVGALANAFIQFAVKGTPTQEPFAVRSPINEFTGKSTYEHRNVGCVDPWRYNPDATLHRNGAGGHRFDIQRRGRATRR